MDTGDPGAELIGPDLILLLLSAPSEVANAENRINGITRLEKLLFLADKETAAIKKVKEKFEFRPYDLGPYSKEIYEAVDLLEEAGLVEESRSLEGHTLDEVEELSAVTSEREGVERQFELTEGGRAVASLLGRSHPDVVAAFQTIKKAYAGMPLRRLIRFVYDKYPDYAVNSRIRDDLGLPG